MVSGQPSSRSRSISTARDWRTYLVNPNVNGPGDLEVGVPYRLTETVLAGARAYEEGTTFTVASLPGPTPNYILVDSDQRRVRINDHRTICQRLERVDGLFRGAPVRDRPN